MRRARFSRCVGGGVLRKGDGDDRELSCLVGEGAGILYIVAEFSSPNIILMMKKKEIEEEASRHGGEGQIGWGEL